MKVAVFLISLCLILMGGADRVLAGTHSKSCCYSRTYHHEMMQEGKKSSSPADVSEPKHTDISAINNFFTFDGVDEEETDETFTRKFSQAGKFYELLSFQSILSRLDDLFRTPGSLFHQGSDKYIFQRAFRV